ncbi:hypothetical protein [Rhodopseudomonas sp. P2A-2r]|uniref:hypothetical protein n=1 Tax=unclassified Rhodopseudomonas TaxID=2638247 RepID=UPI0022348D50|nr:hypothetical protein [Rhodopseudomonas sp. P2A-2r]UZE46914.1 hypothetical protein ONR75_17975 [Rhodopseudomonas sp. P2A-2r]
MKPHSVICPMIVLATLNVAAAESLEQRFGPDRERGHRAEREFEGKRDGFRNRDRANFLGVERQPDPEEFAPHHDLHHSPPIGLQK